MLPKPSQQPESPRRKANIISKLLFTWLIPLFVKGYRKDFTHLDVFRALPGDETKLLGDRLEAAWFEQIAKIETKYGSAYQNDKSGGGEGEKKQIPKPSLVRAVVKVFGLKMTFYGIAAFMEECVFKIVQPIILGYLLDYFASPQNYQPYHGYLFAGGVLVLSMLYFTTDHPYTFAVQHLGMQMRISLIALIYRKSLRVSKYAMEQTPAGQIINFLSSDMNRFDILFTFFHYTWIAPIQLFNVIAVLYYQADLGYASLVGLILLFLFMPFQALMGHMFSKLRAQTAERTDERLLALEEILSAIRVIKMYTWEKPFCSQVSDSRNLEVKKLKMTAMCRALNQSFYSVTSRLTLFITLTVYILSGHKLTVKKVYVTFALYHAVQTVMTLFFPMAVISLAETLVSLERIRKFLLMEEKVVPLSAIKDSNMERVRKYDWTLVSSDDGSITSQYTYTTTSFDTTSLGEVGVWVRDMAAQWSPNINEPSFSSVTFDIQGGEVMAIIGPTASGKSSILNSLLYELPVKIGEFKMIGKVAYSCQEPWVFNGSVRENILFGKPYNPSWYDEVVEACALTKDFQLLPYGDRSFVGEKGSELSGGQKARVTLARAVYADADIYFLDDPLSAVDAQVGRHIVDKCILGLLKNKCRILVTHQLQHIKRMDKILLMVDGRMAHYGDYKSLQNSGIPFSELLSTIHDAHSMKGQDPLSLPSVEVSISATGVGIQATDKAQYLDTVPVKVRETVLEEPEEVDEFIEKGAVGVLTIYRYFNTGSSVSCILMLTCMYIVTQCLVSGTDIYLKMWLALEKEIDSGYVRYSHNPFIRHIQESSTVRITIYTFLICSLFVLTLIRTQMFFRRCMKSSVVIYDRLFYGVVRSPIRFFEQTPVGRILNRFAKDISIIDENLPQALYDVTEIFMQTMGILLVLVSQSWLMVIPSFLLLVALNYLRKFYFRTAISIKRLEGVARSPIFNHLSTTLAGLPTIRAFGVEKKFAKDFEDIHDVHNSCWYLFLCGTRWLGLTTDWFVIVFLWSIILYLLISFDPVSNVKEGDGNAGLVLTSAMSLTSMLQWGMRQSAELENHVIAFERVSEYCELLPEAALESEPDKRPPPTWPSFGEIRFYNLCLRYVQTGQSTVLKNITCRVNGGEKVGIVGRTGAGKSSLINVLFRLAEPTSGYIEIDGIETTSIGLHELRGKISIIPQEPIIFGGTIRINLDPFSEYTDAQLWNALQEVHLTETVKFMNAGLDSEISEGGSNFSSGQKQLLCLARCILKCNKILILDEATASIDPETDRLIQKTIRRNFNDCTVLTIAHRLHTVMDSDRILVLNAGQIMEFDEPQVLLNNRHSMLYKLVQQTGKAEASNLAQIAKLAALRRRQMTQNTVSNVSSKYIRSSDSSYTTILTEEDDIII